MSVKDVFEFVWGKFPQRLLPLGLALGIRWSFFTASCRSLGNRVVLPSRASCLARRLRSLGGFLLSSFFLWLSALGNRGLQLGKHLPLRCHSIPFP